MINIRFGADQARAKSLLGGFLQNFGLNPKSAQFYKIYFVVWLAKNHFSANLKA